jgi:5'-phosphate synthase pdxT subunit
VNCIGENVKVLSTLNDGRIVAVREKNMLATSFHPELTGDTRMHEYFVKMAKEADQDRQRRLDT